MIKFLSTYSGLKLDPSNITPDQLRIEDIAAGLSAMPRFAAQTKDIFTVASHSIILSEMVPPELAKCALLHDFTEALLMDIPSPVKRLLPDYQWLETRLMKVGCEAFGFTESDLGAIKPYDKEIAEYERQVLFGLTAESDYTNIMVRIFSELKLQRSTIMTNFIDRYTQLL